MDKHFVCNRPVSAHLYPGRFITVSNISAAAPIPRWVAECAHAYEGTVTDPWLVDAAAVAAEARDVARTWNVPPVPNYSRSEIKTLLHVDDDGLTQLEHAYGLPRRELVPEQRNNGHFFERTGNMTEQWNGAQVNAWLAALEKIFPAIAKRRG
jgi:hypothetical protein